MKKVMYSMLTLFLIIVISFQFGCQKISTASQPEKSDQYYNKLFELELYSDKKIYKTTDSIKIWATLKYIGNNNEIKIWHGIPYISFSILDGKNFNVEGLTHTILTSTTLQKGTLYTFDYIKNGSYSNDDPNVEYWQKFYKEKELILPAGVYTIKVGGAFFLNQNAENNNKNNLAKELKIKVTDSNNESNGIGPEIRVLSPMTLSNNMTNLNGNLYMYVLK